MTENLKSDLEKILKKDKRLVDENGELNSSLIHEYASSLDEGLICLLLNEKATRDKFFVKVKDINVFKQSDFKFFLDENKIDNSYTQYANQIGLSTGGKFLKDIDDVVLDFPYKDCILEGGQSTEEGTDTYFEFNEEKEDYVDKEAKRKEIFFSQVLAKDEIDRLTEPKALNNIKRYTEAGEEKLKTFNRNKEGKINENLIIKGNNMLALYSLKEQFKGRIKLIYIDPPYNTGSDSFKYNDSFNRSSWLTFMKNRLEVAYDLLHESGSLFVQIDHHMLGYLTVLMDQIFGLKNKVQIISVKTASPAGFKTVNPGPIDVTEYILFYTKNKPSFNFKKNYVEVDYDDNYKYVIENPTDNPEDWKLIHIRDKVYQINGIKVGKTWHVSNKNAKSKWGEYWKVIRDQMIAAFALENPEIVVSIRDPHKPTKELKKLLADSKKTKDKVFVYNKGTLDENDENNGNKGYVINGGALSFYSNKVRNIDGTVAPTELLTDFWKDLSWDGIAKEGGVKLKNGKKPEKLIKRIIEIGTDTKDDFILDFHLGSGTTAAAAHKLGYKYIGIEQLDYDKNDSVVRLNNCINNDQSGISQIANWKGGGSFVYCELAKNNAKAIEKIIACKSLKELIKLFDELYKKYFLSYNLKVKEFKENVSKEEKFQNLTFTRQKEIFARMLDLNQLYINVSDMEDSQFKLLKEDIALTKDFYQL